MKIFKYILISCFVLNTIPCFAQMEMMDLPDEFDQLKFQQNVTDKDFNTAIDSIKGDTKRGKKENKTKEKALKNQPKLEGDILNTPFEFVKLENTLLTLPYNIQLPEKPLEQGFYQVKKIKINNAFFIELKQGHDSTLIPMKKTQEEFEDDNLTFIKTQKYKDYLKIIFVDMDDTLVNYFKINSY